MAPLTTFRIGGRASLFLEPRTSVTSPPRSTPSVAKTQIPVAVLGKGSNVLVADAGFAGLVRAARARVPLVGARRRCA